jgi:hypothetical protein|tara:strand:- start:146746 stop:147243 length:498 start_codon:yes stop_codon:yes gene_type:complete
MRKIIKSVFILALFGCNTGQYQSYQSGYGYQSEQRNDNVYHVTYTAGRSTNIEKVNDFALLRSAELTLEKGFKYFVITRAQNNKDAGKNKYNMSARALTGTGRESMPAGGVGASAAMPTAGTESTGPKVKSEMTIVMYKEEPIGIVYNASQIVLSLKDEYQIDKL